MLAVGVAGRGVEVAAVAGAVGRGRCEEHPARTSSVKHEHKNAMRSMKFPFQIRSTRSPPAQSFFPHASFRTIDPPAARFRC